MLQCTQADSMPLLAVESVTRTPHNAACGSNSCRHSPALLAHEPDATLVSSSGLQALIEHTALNLRGAANLDGEA